MFISVVCCRCCCCVYLILNQHGDIDKHVMELLDAVFQPLDVFVTSFDLIQGLLVDLRVHDLRREGGSVWSKEGTENKERQQKVSGRIRKCKKKKKKIRERSVENKLGLWQCPKKAAHSTVYEVPST